MKIQIKHKLTNVIIFEHDVENNSWKTTVELAIQNKISLRGAYLWGADLQEADLQRADLQEADLRWANLQRADLQEADLQRADLRRADLQEADLQRADLQEADLQRADLQRADLQGADLQEADLRGVENCYPKLFRNELSILKHQPIGTKLIAYKYLDGDTSPYQKCKYEIGNAYSCDFLDKDETKVCSNGVNVATLEWCLKETNNDLTRTYIVCQYEVKEDNIIIPFNTDGKFRVDEVKVLRKLTKEELQRFLDTGILK